MSIHARTTRPALAALSLILAAAFAAALLGAPRAANAQPGDNPGYFAMQKKLDQGGSFYLYSDLRGRMRVMAGKIEAALPEMGLSPEVAASLSMVFKELDRSGLYDIGDLGLSSAPDGDLFLNKYFLGIPGGRKGLLALFGGPAHPLDALAYAPADTMAFSVMEFDAAGLYQFVRDSVKNVGGDAALMKMDEKLAEDKAKSGIDAEKLIKSLGPQYCIVATLDPAGKLTIPLPPQRNADGSTTQSMVQIDSPRMAVIIDVKDSSLYDAMKSEFTENNEAGAETEANGLKLLTLKTEPNPSWDAAPVIASDAGHFYFSTHADYLQKVIAAKQAGGGLTQSEEYKKLGAGMPADANHLTFVSGQLTKTLGDAFQKASASAPQEMRGALNLIIGLVPTNAGFISVSSNLPDGVMTISRSPIGAETALFGATTLPFVAIGAAIAVPNFLEAQTRAKVARAKADQRSLSAAMESYYADSNAYAAQNRPSTFDTQVPDQISRAKADMRTMATALEAYRIDNNTYPAPGHLSSLTTPITYMLHLMPDQFALDQPTYQYYPQPGAGGGFTSWIIWSAGPDRVFNLTPEGLAGAFDATAHFNVPYVTENAYDPAKGTLSAGDIFRTQ